MREDYDGNFGKSLKPKAKKIKELYVSVKFTKQVGGSVVGVLALADENKD